MELYPTKRNIPNIRLGAVSICSWYRRRFLGNVDADDEIILNNHGWYGRHPYLYCCTNRLHTGLSIPPHANRLPGNHWRMHHCRNKCCHRHSSILRHHKLSHIGLPQIIKDTDKEIIREMDCLTYDRLF